MKRLCNTFLVRCWQLNGGEQRFAVQHIQSGARTVAGTLAEIHAWMQVVTQPPTDDLRAPPHDASP